MAAPDEVDERDEEVDRSPERRWLEADSSQELFAALEDGKIVLSLRKRLLVGVAACRRASRLLARRRSRVAVAVALRSADGLATEQQVDEALFLARAGAEAANERARRVSHHNDSLICVHAFVASAAQSTLEGNAAQAFDFIERARGRRFWTERGGSFHYVDDPSSDWEHFCQEEERLAVASHVQILREVVGNPFRPVAFDSGWRTSTVVALAEGIYNGQAFDGMPVLADALQDAGYDHEDILNHCRSETEHVRGCWVLDGILGRSS